ncbi:MAG TPA: transglycosylase domain-containing protein [Flexivirga sp.]|uniref:transglycosylase domain-containing protein n=1 Tax=Flexivirga sp. TaxID=1962927 RepID=UPI002BB85918|nr:transglycosylase domain-containing protein [Flexivirga sp.]HWC22725.1 transglycosylase domain-containing protein [Flexivirga sp.]
MTDEQDGAGPGADDGAPTSAGRRGPGRPRGKKEHGLAYKVFWRTVLGFVALGLIGVIALVIIYLRTSIPQPQANAGKQVSIVYYSDGKTELGRFSTVNREDVTIDKVPKQVRYEFLAAEDRDFYKNSGVSVSGTLRAAWSTLSGGQEQGGSTITQQYVKNYFLTQDRSVKRKVNEIMIALKIDRKMSKDDILQAYLNNIYFGRGAYGIQAASQAYFGVDVDKIDASQGAFLASVINAPGLYDPQFGDAAKARANARMTYVLDGMVKEGWMTRAQRAKAHMPAFKKYKPNAQQVSGPNGYIVSSVRGELERKLKLTPEDIDRGGLRITTTIDKNSQKAAVAAVEKNVPSQTARLDALHTGLVAEKPDGAVVAMYGGEDASKEISAANDARLQGGSSFKAFGLAAALQDGMTLQTRFSGASPLNITGANGKPQKVYNDNHEQFGMLTLERAFAVSSNTAFVRLNEALGTGKTLGAAQQLGIPASSPDMNRPATTDILGSAAVRVIDMANAYNTISAQGKKADPYFIKKVSSVEGDYSYDAHPDSKQAISKDIAANLVNGMTGPLKDPDGTAHKTAGLLKRPAAGKTGTSSFYKSAWFTGFTPDQLTASVGMYAGSGKNAGTIGLDKATHNSSFYGGDIPATIWRDFMQAALKGQPVAKLPKTKEAKPTQTYVPPVTTTTTQPPTTSSTTTPSSTPTSTTSSSSSSSTTSSSTSSSTPPSPTSTTTTTTQPPSSTATPPSSTPLPPPPTLGGGGPPSSSAQPTQ